MKIEFHKQSVMEFIISMIVFERNLLTDLNPSAFVSNHKTKNSRNCVFLLSFVVL